MDIKTNTPREKTYSIRWKTKNKKGWELYNKMIQDENKKKKLANRKYEDTLKLLQKTLSKTIGKKR